MTKAKFASLRRGVCLLLCTLVLQLVSVAAEASTTYLVFGQELAPRLQERVTELLKRVPQNKVIVVRETSGFIPEQGSWVLSFGENDVTRRFMSRAEALSQGPEGFVIRTAQREGANYIVTNGNPAAPNERSTMRVNRGLSFGTYEILQGLGFQFLHPFTPRVPKELAWNANASISERPRWPIRGFHLHTMHPIELTHVLNGWGPQGPNDEEGFIGLTSEWDLYLEWMIANRQNIVEWILLADKKYKDFNDSPVRQKRLAHLVSMAHAWGIVTGIDVGVVLEQQNAWRLVRKTGKEPEELMQVRNNVAWLMKTGADYLSVELGFNEFQSADDQKFLRWLNFLTEELEHNYNRPVFMKIHISSGQESKKLKDPDTGKPLNANFLPHFADPRLVVMPHTVQLYSLDDPAPTYGNTDFKEMHRFISMEAGSRPVVWYPEVGYWVSYDANVPLHLPSYAERRFHDLRLIAGDEDRGALGRGAKKGSSIQGQIVFSSGFEWGYWFHHVVSARAAWDPHMELSEPEAWTQILRDIFRVPSENTEQLISMLTHTVQMQNDLLIRGRIAGKDPKKFEKLTGMAELAGQDTWNELNVFLADVIKKPHFATQPNRMKIHSFKSSLKSKDINYVTDLKPLLNEMEVQFDSDATKYEILASRTTQLDPYFEEVIEFADGARINALRAKQMHALRDVAAAKPLKLSAASKSERLQTARLAVDQAQDLTLKREEFYRADPERLAGWGENPTVYRYAYLWQARSLYFWWRDEGRVVGKAKNLCYMNIINPFDTAFAAGKNDFKYKLLATLGKVISLGECLAPKLTVEPIPKLRAR